MCLRLAKNAELQGFMIVGWGNAKLRLRASALNIDKKNGDCVLQDT